MARTWPLLRDGNARRTPQDETLATKFGRRGPQDGLIEWSAAARDIYNLVRSVTHPFPGAFTHIDGRKLFIWKAWPIESHSAGNPGEVLGIDPFLVGTGESALRIDRCQLEGETEMDGPAFAANSLRPGKKLGGNHL
jgi:methionyl-tRNA formyltransferase